MTTWYLDMGSAWIVSYLPKYTSVPEPLPRILDVPAYGSAGGRTLTVATGTGTNYGNYASGKIWSVLTWGNQPVEVVSVDGDVLTLKGSLKFDTVKIRYAYITNASKMPYRITKIYHAKIMENFNTEFKPDQESTTVDKSKWARPLPTTFFETDIGVGRTLAITGHLLSDNRRSAKQYRDSLWNLIRLGWVYVIMGFLDDNTGVGTNNGMEGFIIKNVKIDKKASESASSGKTPSNSYSRDDLRVTIQLLFAPQEGFDIADKELVEVA